MRDVSYLNKNIIFEQEANFSVLDRFSKQFHFQEKIWKKCTQGSDPFSEIKFPDFTLLKSKTFPDI